MLDLQYSFINMSNFFQKSIKQISKIYLKSQVYSPWPKNLDELEANIRRVVGNLQPGVIRNAIMDIKKRAQMCINAGGGHFDS